MSYGYSTRRNMSGPSSSSKRQILGLRKRFLLLRNTDILRADSGGWYLDEDYRDEGGDGDEVPHSARTATTVFVCMLIEVHSSAPFKSSRFGEGTEIPRCPPMGQPAAKGSVPEAVDADDPLLTIPPPQYNAMLCFATRCTCWFFFGGIDDL